jgi:hypothetical protein
MSTLTPQLAAVLRNTEAALELLIEEFAKVKQAVLWDRTDAPSLQGAGHVLGIPQSDGYWPQAIAPKNACGVGWVSDRSVDSGRNVCVVA